MERTGTDNHEDRNMKYRKRPVVIEAFKWGRDDPPEWWVGRANAHAPRADGSVTIATLEGDHRANKGDHRANKGDYIIQGVEGELYPCKPSVFLATYELAGES